MRSARSPLLVTLFVVYLALLTWIILWKLTVPWIGEAAFLPHPIKLIPFFPSGDADVSNPIEVIANFLFFVPFGLYLGVLARRWWIAAPVFLGTSLLFEVTQHLLSIGSFDITDVIMNTAGGLAGWALFVALGRRVPTRVFVIGTVAAALAIALFIASPIRYAPQHDVIFGQR